MLLIQASARRFLPPPPPSWDGLTTRGCSGARPTLMPVEKVPADRFISLSFNQRGTDCEKLPQESFKTEASSEDSQGGEGSVWTDSLSVTRGSTPSWLCFTLFYFFCWWSVGWSPSRVTYLVLCFQAVEGLVNRLKAAKPHCRMAARSLWSLAQLHLGENISRRCFHQRRTSG